MSTSSLLFQSPCTLPTVTHNPSSSSPRTIRLFSCTQAPQNTAKAANNLALGLQTATEVKHWLDLPVTGTIPSYLTGKTLYRVGPGRYEVAHSDNKPYRIDHWFDALSLLHAFVINGSTNTVAYRNRYMVDGMVDAIESTPRARWNAISFGSSDPCRSLLGRLFQMFSTTPFDKLPYRPNIGVTVQEIPGKGVTVRTDLVYQNVLNETDLEVDEFFGFSQFNNALKGYMSCAHGHYDRKTAEYFNVCYDMNGPSTTFTVFKTGKDGHAQILANIKREPSYVHSFAVTENYVVLILWPLFIEPLKVLWSKDVLSASNFRGDEPTTFYVISRHGDGLSRTYTSDAFFCFHNVNAFERDSGNGGYSKEIVIDLCKYDDDEILNDMRIERMTSLPKLSTSLLTRFVLGDSGTIERSIVSAHPFELPHMNPRFERKEYTYTYGVSGRGLFEGIVKMNVKTGTHVLWSRPNIIVGEPIFVPDPNGRDEDDGCVLVVVLECDTKTSALAVLDARSMTEVATAKVSQIVPLGFHGVVTSREQP